MAENMHTLRPWKIRGGLAGTYEIQFGDDGECVAEIVHEKADAVLMVAAPDMLEAGEWVLNVASGVSRGGGTPSSNEYTDSMNALKAAIEKATERKG